MKYLYFIKKFDLENVGKSERKKKKKSKTYAVRLQMYRSFVTQTFDPENKGQARCIVHL